jgi:hypothetical protein
MSQVIGHRLEAMGWSSEWDCYLYRGDEACNMDSGGAALILNQAVKVV